MATKQGKIEMIQFPWDMNTDGFVGQQVIVLDENKIPYVGIVDSRLPVTGTYRVKYPEAGGQSINVFNDFYRLIMRYTSEIALNEVITGKSSPSTKISAYMPVKWSQWKNVLKNKEVNSIVNFEIGQSRWGVTPCPRCNNKLEVQKNTLVCTNCEYWVALNPNQMQSELRLVAKIIPNKSKVNTSLEAIKDICRILQKPGSHENEMGYDIMTYLKDKGLYIESTGMKDKEGTLILIDDKIQDNKVVKELSSLEKGGINFIKLKTFLNKLLVSKIKPETFEDRVLSYMNQEGWIDNEN